eukprot:g6610.t1
MARGNMKSFKDAVPLAFFAIPASGRALAYVVPPSFALVNVTGRAPAFQGRCGHRITGSDGSLGGGWRSRRTLRRARGGQVGSAVQIATFDEATDHTTTERRATPDGEAEPSLASPGTEEKLPPPDLEGGVLDEFRLRRGLRKLGQLRKPQDVLDFLAAAKERGDPLSLRVFNTAITAVAPCEEGCRYALRLLVLMQEEQVPPDRVTLTAIVASCLRSQKWDVAYGVLQKMQRQGTVPLDLRPGRFAIAPGEPGEARDRVLRLLQRLRSTEDARSPPLPSSPDQRAGGPAGREGDRGSDRGSSDGGMADRMSRRGGGKAVEARQRVVHSVPRRQLRSAAGEKAGTGAGPSEKIRRIRSAAAGGRSGAAVSLNAGSLQQGGDGGGGNVATNKALTLGKVDISASSTWVASLGGEETMLAAGARPREEDFLAELKGAAKTKSWEHALGLLDAFRRAGYQPRPGAYACAIRACGKAGKWEHSLALMDEMRSRGVEPGEGCNVMALKACADAGLWEKTLGMLKDMRASGVNRSESTFVVAMKACGDAGRWKEALALMDDMRRDGTPPMETTYTTAMKACGAAGEWEQALKLFQEMQAIGIPPTEQCYTAAIRACAKADKTAKASSLLLKMRAARGVSTNMSSYRAVMDAYCRAGDWAAAQGILEDARRDQLKPDAGDLRAMVEACGKAEQHERALSLLEEMRSEGMNLRRTGEKLWWVFNTCRDRQVKDRAWLLMEVEETRKRARQRAERNANKAEAVTATAATATATSGTR